LLCSSRGVVGEDHNTYVTDNRQTDGRNIVA